MPLPRAFALLCRHNANTTVLTTGAMLFFENPYPFVPQVRDLIYREALEYHPQAKREYYSGERPSGFQFPSAVDNFKRQFAHLEGGGARDLRRQANSLPREQMETNTYRHESGKHHLLHHADTMQNGHDSGPAPMN